MSFRSTIRSFPRCFPLSGTVGHSNRSSIGSTIFKTFADRWSASGGKGTTCQQKNIKCLLQDGGNDFPNSRQTLHDQLSSVQPVHIRKRKCPQQQILDVIYYLAYNDQKTAESYQRPNGRYHSKATIKLHDYPGMQTDSLAFGMHNSIWQRLFQ